MMQRARRIGCGLFATLAIATAAIVGFTGSAPAADERLEVSGIKAVRTKLVEPASARQQGNIAKAKETFDDYDSAWNGIEVYINTRSKPMYDKIELDLQARINKALEGPSPDLAKLRADIQEMIAKYDEAIAMRSEEHTSELQSPDHLVCRLLLEKKKIQCDAVTRRCARRRYSPANHH